jgi:Tol biopolymer transport system component
MDADGSNPINLTNNAPINKTFGLAPLPRSELNLNEISYRIVFESLRETDGRENREICLVEADGSNLINLTNTPEIDEIYPHASPDGRKICFEAVEEYKESKSRNVYYMNIDGTNRVKIAENAYQPCWSPDGKYIAYAPGEYPRFDPRAWANKGLVIYDLETGEMRRNPNDEISNLINICWSPDGKWFAASSRGVNRAFKADDKTMIILPTPGCRPDISPDGKQIAWNGSKWNINIGTLDFDSPQSSVTDHSIVIACERDFRVYNADWSPDGSYLTFSYVPANVTMKYASQKSSGSNICICDLSTGKWTLITTDGKHNKDPDWVPIKLR